MAKRFYGAYEGREQKNAQESTDGAMMPSGIGSYANMPESLVMREYPRPYDGMPENIDDSIRGIDGQIKKDNMKKRANLQPEKV